MIEARAGWKPARLDELGFVGRGKSRHRPRNAPFLYGGPYPFFQTGDVKAADLHLSEYAQTYSEAGLAQSKLWKPGTLCITIAANIAESAILSISGCFPDSVVGFVADDEKADVRFIKYYLDTLKVQMQNISRGTTQDNLSLEKLLGFDLYVPSVRTQRAIADVLSTYDELIENSSRRIRVLEAMARALYFEWFGRSDGVAAKPVVEMETFGDLCALMTERFTENLHAGRPLLDLARIPSGSIAATETGEASELTTSRIVFEKGDTLFGAIRCYLHKVVISHFSGVTNTSVLVLRPTKPCFRSLVALIASDVRTIRWADTHSTGTKMPVIGWSVLRTMPLSRISRARALKFEETVGPLMDEIGVHARQIQTLKRTRDLLLPRLMSGQTRLSLNEPARLH